MKLTYWVRAGIFEKVKWKCITTGRVRVVLFQKIYILVLCVCFSVFMWLCQVAIQNVFLNCGLKKKVESHFILVWHFEFRIECLFTVNSEALKSESLFLFWIFRSVILLIIFLDMQTSSLFNWFQGTYLGSHPSSSVLWTLRTWFFFFPSQFVLQGETDWHG